MYPFCCITCYEHINRSRWIRDNWSHQRRWKCNRWYKNRWFFWLKTISGRLHLHQSDQCFIIRIHLLSYYIVPKNHTAFSFRTDVVHIDKSTICAWTASFSNELLLLRWKKQFNTSLIEESKWDQSFYIHYV